MPAHSCILSAISPHLSSALSSNPAPPAGQSRLLEFRALGACTLLHMVRLLYSGEMVGEGESEKQEAISAAANLGINGLVEVMKNKTTGVGGGGGEVGQYTEIGVQTEPERMEETEGRQSRWRRVLRDGSTFLWKETLSDGGKDMWTQTEELHVNTATPAHPAAFYETVDMDAFQSIQQTDCHQFVPVTLIYPPNENQTPQPLPAASAPVQESTAAGSTSVDVVAPPFTIFSPSLSQLSNHDPSFAANHQSCLAGSQAADRDVRAAEEWEGERLEQFQGNIPGFISYFLNPENTDGTKRRRAGTRQRAGVRGGRRSGTGEQRARTPRGRTGGRGRGGFTQKVDVQEVGVGKLQKLFLHRWEMRTPRTGQGGGAVGRKLFLKSREVLKPSRTYQRRRGRGKEWEVSQSGDLLLCSGGRGGNTQCGRKNTLHLSQVS